MSDPIVEMAIKLIDEIVEAAVRSNEVLDTGVAAVKVRNAVPELPLSSEALTNIIVERAIAGRAVLRLETPLEIIPPPIDEEPA